MAPVLTHPSGASQRQQPSSSSLLCGEAGRTVAKSPKEALQGAGSGARWFSPAPAHRAAPPEPTPAAGDFSPDQLPATAPAARPFIICHCQWKSVRQLSPASRCHLCSLFAFCQNGNEENLHGRCICGIFPPSRRFRCLHVLFNHFCFARLCPCISWALWQIFALSPGRPQDCLTLVLHI